MTRPTQHTQPWALSFQGLLGPFFRPPIIGLESDHPRLPHVRKLLLRYTLAEYQLSVDRARKAARAVYPLADAFRDRGAYSVFAPESITAGLAHRTLMISASSLLQGLPCPRVYLPYG